MPAPLLICPPTPPASSRRFSPIALPDQMRPPALFSDSADTVAPSPIVCAPDAPSDPPALLSDCAIVSPRLPLASTWPPTLSSCCARTVTAPPWMPCPAPLVFVLSMRPAAVRFSVLPP